MRPCDLLIEAGWIVTNPSNVNGAIIRNGAVCVTGGRIVALGPLNDLCQHYRPARTLGGPDIAVIPGFINSHDHGRGVPSLQLGIEDDLLEPWLLDLLRLPPLSLFHDTQQSALQQLHSGITTTCNSFYQPGNYAADLEEMTRAYRVTGINCAMILSTMDHSMVNLMLESIRTQLPTQLRNSVDAFLEQRKPFDQSIFAQVASEFCQPYTGQSLWGMIGPVSVHWCSDSLLNRLIGLSKRLGVAMQTHCLESPWQRREADRRWGQPVKKLHEMGFLKSGVSLAHCVQLKDNEYELIRESRTSIVHNPSSNLRLGNGVASLYQWLQQGINVGLGLDSLSFHDDANVFFEMRLAQRLQRGISKRVSSRQIIHMATMGSALALGIANHTGQLAKGYRADLLMMNADELYFSHALSDDQLFDRIVNWGRPSLIHSVIVGGQQVMQNGRHTSLKEQKMPIQLAPAQSGKELSWIRELKPHLHRWLIQELNANQ